AQKAQNKILQSLGTPTYRYIGIFLFCAFCAFLWLSSEAGDHAFVDLAGDAHVVEVVFADQIELAGLVEIEDLAAFDFRRLARLDPERPRHVVKTHETLRAQPPAMHRVENAARRVLREIHERARLE